MKGNPRTIDEYLAGLGEDKRAALQKLRLTIRAAAPNAEECISYRMPAFRAGQLLVAFGAAAGHCAFYPMSSSTVEAFKDELKGYQTRKARFTSNRTNPSRRPLCARW